MAHTPPITLPRDTSLNGTLQPDLRRIGVTSTDPNLGFGDELKIYKGGDRLLTCMNACVSDGKVL